MHMKTFAHILKQKLCARYPEINFSFYVLRRSNYMHMGLHK